MENHLLTPEDLSARWNITLATLSQWRWNGRGPRFVKMGKGIRYRLSDIERFEGQRLCQSTSEYTLRSSIEVSDGFPRPRQ